LVVTHAPRLKAMSMDVLQPASRVALASPFTSG
jgi:hypothetical protein